MIKAKVKSTVHRLCDNPVFSNLIRNIIEAGMITVKRKLRNALGNTGKKTILDVACGTGEFSNLVQGRYIGIDLDRKHIRYANRKHGTKIKRFAVRDAKDTKLPDKSVDITLMINFIHHVPDLDMKDIFTEIRRVTKEKIIVSDVIPLKYNPVGKFLLSMDQGSNIRTLIKQKRILGRNADIIKVWKPFRSGMNIHTIIELRPDTVPPQ